MAEFEAIGKALQIPQSVLNNIEKIDQKINLIASDSEKMATHFMSAMTRMGTGADGLLQKLTAIQSVIGRLDLSKFSQSVTTVGQGTTQVEQFAAAISKAAEAINRYNIENRERANTDNSNQIAQLNKEIEAMRKRTQQLEEYINKQREANQGGGRRGGGSSSSGTNSDTKALNAYNRAMAASEALVTQRINKIAKLRNAEEQLRNASGNYATQLNRISQEIARLNRLNEGQVDSYGRVIRSQRNLVNTSQQLTRQLALLFSVSQIEGYISKLVQVRGEFELQQVALTSILQNKDQADQLFAQITDLAVRSPFTIKELTTYTKSLAAYQVQYEDLYDTTKMLADVSAGLGVDMQRLILAFGQVKAANFLRGTETRQFTEAGINMLGELSKYYTELEGRIVSVQEVQDRQFKRMISFQDVEEVFKRLTSAGGMFYNMQERQAETLAGQMSNLRDQFDLMFNEIGKDNQGAINTSISAIKLLIENWEIFANMLKAAAVGWATYTTTTLIAASANGKFAASAVAVTTSTKGLVGITAKLITSMKALGVFLKTNPITIIATALASAIYFWNDHRKAVEENRKAYDPLVNSVNKTITAVDELTKKIGEQNDRIRTANDNVSQYEKGTSEYARAEANANEEREKQNRLLEELKTKYPEIYNGIIRQKDGTVDYTNALKEFNGQLEQQNYLNYLARRTATGEDNGFLNNASKAAEAQQNLKIATEDANNALILMQGKIREYFATNEYASEDLRKRLEDVGNSSLSSGEKINKMFQIIRSEHGINIGPLKDMAWGFEEIGRGALKAEKELQDANEELAEDIKQISTEYKSAYDTTSEEGKRTSQELLENFLKNVGIQNQAVLDFVKQQFEVTIGVKLDLSNQVKQELGEVEKRVNDYLDENQFNLVGRIGIGESFEKYMKELQDSLTSWQRELNELESATGERVAGGTNKQRIDELKTSIAQATETLKYWGKYQTQTTGGGSSKNPELEKLKEQVAMIEKAAKSYEDYRKLYDEETAQRMVETAFAKPFENLDLNFAMTFDAQGIIEAYKKLAQSVGGDAQEYIEGKIAEGLTDVTTDQRTKEVEEYRKQIDELFASLSNYQELEKLGLNKELISQLFGINVSSINDVQDVFEKIKDKLKEYGNEGEKLIADSEKKITDAQQKNMQELIKNYATTTATFAQQRETLKKQYDEIISYVGGKRTEDNTEEIDNIAKTIENNYRKALQKINWEEFKSTSDYGIAFGDLSSVSTSTIKRVYNAINKFKNAAIENEDAESVKTYVDLMEQLWDKMIERGNAFDNLKSSMDAYNEALQNMQDAEREYENASSLFNQEYALADEERKNELIEQRRAAYDNLSSSTNRYYKSVNNLAEAENRVENIYRNFASSLSNAVGEAFGGEVSSQLQSFLDMFDAVNEAIDTFADSMRNDVAKTAENILDTGEDAITSIADTTENVITGVESTSKAASSAISTVEKASVILTVISAALQIYNQLMNIANEEEQERQEYMQGIIELQLEYNRVLMESKLLHEEVFGSNPFGNIIDDIKTAQEAIDSYNKAANEIQVQWKDPEHKGFLGTIWSGITDIVGALDIFDIGWGDAIKGGVDSAYDLIHNTTDGLVKAIDNLRYVTQHGSKGFLGIGSKGTKTQDLREWVRQNLGAELFDEDGLINLDIANELLNNHAQNLTQDTINTLEELKMYAEIIQQVEDNITEWSTDVFGDLSSNLSDSLVEAFRNGTDAADDFKTHVSKIIETIGEQMLQSMLYDQVFSQYQGKLEELTKKYALGDISDEKYMDALAQLTGQIMNSSGAFIEVGEDFLNQLKEAAKKYGYDIFLPEDGQGDTLSGLEKGIAAASEETVQAAAALLESVRFFESDSNAVLHSFYNAFIMPTEENPFLSELRVQSEQLRLLYGLWNGVIKNVGGSGRAVNVRIV